MIRKTTLSEATAFKGIMLTNNNIKHNIKKYCHLYLFYVPTSYHIKWCCIRYTWLV